LAEQDNIKEIDNDNHNKQMTIDATDCIAGRMCSQISKLLLKGYRVRVVNAEKTMISGNKYMIIDSYMKFLTISSATNPIHGPFHPRRPDRILTRMIRGMLPKRKPSGISALKRLRVYVSVPPELRESKNEKFESSKIRRPHSYYSTLGEIAKQIGWNGMDSYE
jgi:large subunit ribosomal protein L13